MDRRQRKTRDAIFEAFTSLLSKKSANQITVGEIIERANVGRATFYAHFETKEFLLKELCKELFDHIFDAYTGQENMHKRIFDCNAPDSVFVHLLSHLEKNDHHILELLSNESDGIFTYHFKENLKELIKTQTFLFQCEKAKKLPEDFWMNHICVSFVECVKWWVEKGKRASSEEIAKYFLMLIE